MFSKKTVLAGCIILFIAVNIVLLAASMRRHKYPSYIPESFAISIAGPFQKSVRYSIDFIKDIWDHYFSLVSVSEENEKLKLQLAGVLEKKHKCKELEIANARLRILLKFRKQVILPTVAAEVIGKDPSPWFKSIMIDKGESDGIRVSQPVFNHDGIIGVVTDVSNHYAKVMLAIDHNSSIDAIVQRTRARGIIRGGAYDSYYFEYVLRRHEIKPGDTIISSGLDRIYPKGLLIGRVKDVKKSDSGLFKTIHIIPSVDFETLEEVLVLMPKPSDELDMR